MNDKPSIRIDYDSSMLGYAELADAIARELRSLGFRQVNVVRDREDDKRNTLHFETDVDAGHVKQIQECCESHRPHKANPDFRFFDDVITKRRIPYGEASVLISLNRRHTTR